MASDVAMVLVFAIFYVFAARRLVRWISSRFGGDWWPTVIAVVAISLATSAVGVVVGELWLGVMESARFGWTGHMSFRESRVPWQYHRAEFFVAGVILFWLVAVVNCTVARSTRDASVGDC